MQAMNGSAGFRSRGRLIGCCMALVLALSALVFSSAASAAAPPPIETYVALGDSLAFGYSQVKFEENFPNDAPIYFEENYANNFAKFVRAKVAERKGLQVVNLGCPGETTNGLIGENPALGGAKDASHKPCGYRAQGLPLHDSLGLSSQLEEAMSILKGTNGVTGAKPAHPIDAITLNIGANDELAVISSCKAKVKLELEEKGFTEENEKHEPSGNVPEAINFCIASTAQTTTFPHIVSSINTIVKDLAFGGGYGGKIELLGNYNPQSFELPGSDALQEILNQKEEEGVATLNAELAGGGSTATVKFVNPFPKFNPTPTEGVKEKKALEKYTEQFNAHDIAVNEAKHEAANKKEEEEGKTVVFPSDKQEGDIHPSALGYKTLGKMLFEAF
jgi:lysophospholipase L1-like esterase